MPLHPSLVGQHVGTVRAVCDARWLMAYAAGVPDEGPELYDTRAELVTHPLFPVAPEWELLIKQRTTSAGLTPDESIRGVHAAHDVVVDRCIRAGETIDIIATVIGVDRRPAGATQHVLFHATDVAGATVWRTNLTSLFRGVELDGDPTMVEVGWPAPPPPVEPPTIPLAERTSHVRSIDAHVYTECARIWNPIHTDIAVANRAGIEAPILHGTATLARAVSIITELAGVGLADVRRVTGDFAAMVDLDSNLAVRLLARSGDDIRFDVLNAQGRPAVRHGTITLGGA